LYGDKVNENQDYKKTVSTAKHSQKPTDHSFGSGSDPCSERISRGPYLIKTL
jgi:hypothetical protein